MCVILYVPPKKNIKEEYIKNSFDNNPDGSGVMYFNEKGEVNYKKGFMSYKNLKSFWDSLNDNFARAIHCRIATSGVINSKNCHPFSITGNIKQMQKVKGIGVDGCVMHNGVLCDYTPRDKMQSSYSDTMVFNKKVLSPIVKGGFIENVGVKSLIDNIGSAFLLFLPQFKVVRFGEWIYDEDGFYASNDSYNIRVVTNDINFKDEFFYGDYGYDKELIEKIKPRFHYTIEFVYSGKGFPYGMIDDFVDYLVDYIICADQPYCTCSRSYENIYQFEVDTYDIIDGLLVDGFTEVSCKVIK